MFRISTFLSIFLLSWTAAFAAELPNMDVASYVLMDAKTGKILAAKNPHKQIMPASTTKIMTAYLVDKAIEQGTISGDELAPISTKAAHVEGSHMLHTQHESIPVSELYQGMMINSGNDASIALAELIAGSEEDFSELMNQEAKRLGMQNSHFVNPHGLPHPDHRSSAHDLAVVSRALILEYPESYALYSQKNYTYAGSSKRNTNHLLLKQDPTVDGVKTGYTIAAKHCLVASAKRGDVRLIAVVIKAPSQNKRAEYASQLLNYGFDQYETQQIYAARSNITELTVNSGKKPDFQVGLAKALSLTLPKEDFDNLSIVLDVPNTIEAPIAVEQPQGKLIVSLDDVVLAEEPLIALEAVEEKSWFEKLFS